MTDNILKSRTTLKRGPTPKKEDPVAHHAVTSTLAGDSIKKYDVDARSRLVKVGHTYLIDIDKAYPIEMTVVGIRGVEPILVYANGPSPDGKNTVHIRYAIDDFINRIINRSAL